MYFQAIPFLLFVVPYPRKIIFGSALEGYIAIDRTLNGLLKVIDVLLKQLVVLHWYK